MSTKDEQPDPGAALAAEVATKVMGWHKARMSSHPSNPEFWFDSDDNWRAGVDGYRPDLNIAQAWEVFLHVMERKFSTRFKFFSALDVAVMEAAPGEHIMGLWALQLIRKDFPAHICRAALAAERS